MPPKTLDRNVDLEAKRGQDVGVVLAVEVAYRGCQRGPVFWGGSGSWKLTRGAVVADVVVRGVAEDSASRALDRGATNLLGVLPDELGEVAVRAKVGAGGRVGPEEVVVADLGVPLGLDGLGNGVRLVAEIASSTVTSKVLAVLAVSLVPEGLLARQFLT